MIKITHAYTNNTKSHKPTGSRISGTDGNASSEVEDLSDDDADGVNGDSSLAVGGEGAGGSGAHARRLGAAAVNSVEELDEFKKR